MAAGPHGNRQVRLNVGGASGLSTLHRIALADGAEAAPGDLPS